MILSSVYVNVILIYLTLFLGDLHLQYFITAFVMHHVKAK